jgi:hypothetical protein
VDKNMAIKPSADWTSRGKTVEQLIKELKTYENQQLEVRISIDGGETSYPVSILTKRENKYAVIENHEEKPSIIKHGN